MLSPDGNIIKTKLNILCEMTLPAIVPIKIAFVKIAIHVMVT